MQCRGHAKKAGGHGKNQGKPRKGKRLGMKRYEGTTKQLSFNVYLENYTVQKIKKKKQKTKQAPTSVANSCNTLLEYHGNQMQAIN